MVISIVVVYSILLVPPLTQTSRAAISPYSPPCDDTDIEIRGGCCPSDTVQRAHNMCLTQDEVEQRKENSGNLIKCEVGQILKQDPIGGLECMKELTRQ